MNILHSNTLTPPSLLAPPCFNHMPIPTFIHFPNIHACSPHSIKSPPNASRPRHFLTSATNPSNQGTASVAEFEEFVEKDWSFLDFGDADGDGERMQRIDRIISAGDIKETSKVLVSIGSEVFVDRVVRSSPCEELLVVHESLLVLACIKEGHDKVKCWQGEVMDLPEKWSGFDVVYLYFLPALASDLDRVLAALAKRCLPGARVVISHPDGRGVVEELKQQHPDVVVSGLPEKTTLQSTGAGQSFELVEFVDEPGFYLAVMRFSEG